MSRGAKTAAGLLLVMAVCTAARGIHVAGVDPQGCLGTRSDHYSHRNVAALMMRMVEAWGPSSLVKLYEAGVASFLDRPAGESFVVPGQDPRPPLVINWSMFPRPYPPLGEVFHLPDAMLQEWAGTSFITSNRFTLLKYVIFATLALALAIAARFRASVSVEAGAMDVAMCLFAAQELLYWAIGGFYDGFSLCFVVGAIVMRGRGRPLLSIGLWMIAFAVHYRALWYAPVAGFAFLDLVRAGEPRRRLVEILRGPRSRLVWPALGLLAVTAAFLVALGTFWMVYPSFHLIPVTNPLYPQTAESRAWLAMFVLSAVLVTGYGLYRRHFVFAATAAFMGVMLYVTPQMREWHSVWIVPAYLLAISDDRAAPALRVPAILWLGFLAHIYFGRTPLRFPLVQEWLMPLL